MSRESKPFLRKQTKSWYCSIAGRQISLGKDREAAFEKFHALMADPSRVKSELTTLYDLGLPPIYVPVVMRGSGWFDVTRLGCWSGGACEAAG